MQQYLEAHDLLFPLHPQLWLQANGMVLLQTWWRLQFQHFFTDTLLAGQSMLAGGATALTED